MTRRGQIHHLQTNKARVFPPQPAKKREGKGKENNTEASVSFMSKRLFLCNASQKKSASNVMLALAAQMSGCNLFRSSCGE